MKYDNFGRTANEACCVCGGGVSPIVLRAVEVLGECASDETCDSAATNTALTWFYNSDNHLVDDDDWDDQVWRVSRRISHHSFHGQNDYSIKCDLMLTHSFLLSILLAYSSTGATCTCHFVLFDGW